MTEYYRLLYIPKTFQKTAFLIEVINYQQALLCLNFLLKFVS